jgi:DNA-binding NarL/FixJ family response regulator
MLRAALDAVAAELVVLPQITANHLLEQQPAVAALDAQQQTEALTTREQEVLVLLSQGLPNKLIARELGISEHTVKFHVSSLYAKLGASSRTEAVSRGARRGLISF